MKISQWFKFRRKYNKQIKKLPDKSAEKIIETTFNLYPNEIDISDGELRGKKGFWSENLSYALHNAEEQNIPYSQEINFMIWAVYGELHTKSIGNFKNGIMKVCLSELNRDTIIKRYIKALSEADK